MYVLVFWIANKRGNGPLLDRSGLPCHHLIGIYTSKQLAIDVAETSTYWNPRDHIGISIHQVYPNTNNIEADGIHNSPCVYHYGDVPFYTYHCLHS